MKVYNVYESFGQYDGQSGSRIFSSLEKAIEYCNKENDIVHSDDPFTLDGFVIEEHVIDEQEGQVKFYNGNGKFLF